MVKKPIIIFLVFFLSSSIYSEIPDWYKEGVVKYLNSADAVVLYRAESIELVKTVHIYSIYKINAKTLKTLKGSVKSDHCYFIQVEGTLDDWPHLKNIKGQESLAILNNVSAETCSVIDTGFGAPGTVEYVELFESILNAPNKALN